MALERITNPPVLDSTGLAIVQKLEAIKNVVQPVNAGTDIDITIPSSGWSSESPYQYTYSNAHITSGSLVKVTFLEGSGTSTPLYLEFEKVTNGIRFEAPAKPTNDISVRIHIFSADTTSTTATSADEVSTSAVSGASNVDDALSVLDNGKVNTSDIADNLTTNDATKVLSAKQGKMLKDTTDTLNGNLTNNTFNTHIDIDINRVSYQDGGYVKVGNMVFMSICVKGLMNLSNEPGIFVIDSGYWPKKTCALSVIESSNTNIAAALGESVTCGITNTGHVYIKRIVTDKYYFITGAFIV